MKRKKIVIIAVDLCIALLSFTFIISSFFKILSLTVVEKYIYANPVLLLSVWGAGTIIAIVGAPHLYRWMIHFRTP